MFKIAIIGPESSGKTQLSKGLASHYNVPWIAEYARGYVENLTEPYTFDDVCIIAKQQIKYEEECLANLDARFVFFDTDLIITKVWFEYCYNEVPKFVTDKLKSNFIDFYLLCEPDLPWIPDKVREHGYDRDYFFDWYKKEIQEIQTPFSIISGIENSRLENAIQAIENFINKNEKQILNL